MTNKAEFRSLREEVGERWQPRTTSAPEPEASARSQAQDGGSVPPPGRDAALQLFSIYFGESEGAFGVTHDAEHRRNPGRDVMSALDYLHSAKEAVHVAREGVAEEGALGVGETLMGPLAFVNGVGEAMDGIDEYKEATRAGDAQGQGRGLVSVGGGAAGAASGLAPLIGLPGGPVAGSFAAGVGIGKYGSKAVKEMGWLKDEDEKALTPSEWATQKGLAADELAQGSHGLLGNEGHLGAVARVLGPMGMVLSPAATHPGAAATLAASAAGAGLAIVGAEIKARKTLAHLIGDSGPTDVMMHPERYREVDGTPAQEAMKHLAKYGASDKERTP